MSKEIPLDIQITTSKRRFLDLLVNGALTPDEEVDKITAEADENRDANTETNPETLDERGVVKRQKGKEGGGGKEKHEDKEPRRGGGRRKR